MGLQVWLPLTDGIENQGLNGDIVPQYMGTGVTFTNGKIGNAATFPNNSSSCIYMDGLKLQTGSWCAWIKVFGEGSSSSQRIISEGRDMGSVGTNIFVNKAGTILTAHTHNGALQTTISLNTWYHVAITFGDGVFKLYVDGNLISSVSYTEDSDYAQSNDKLVLGKMAHSYSSTGAYFPFNGQINDFRVYDTVLSPLEVKHIAQGLVLHYPLSAPGGENLARNTYNKLEYHEDNFSAVSKTISYPISGFQRKELLLAASEKGLTLSYDISIPFIYRDTSQSLQRCGCYIPFTIKNNSTGTTINYYAHHSQAGIATSYNTYSKTNSLNPISSSATASAPDTSFNGHYSRTIFPNEFSSLSDFFANPDNYTVTGGTSINTEIRGAYIKGECTISNVKLELGSIATPWIPNPADAEYSALGFDDGIEYDVSGFCNNGTKNGAITYDTDTPRYRLSTYFANNNYIKFKLPENMYQITYSFWVKADTYNNHNAIVSRFSNPGGGNGGPWLSVNTESAGAWAYIGNISPNYTKTNIGLLSTGEWHHLCWVFDNGSAKWYVDGQSASNTVTYVTTYLSNTEYSAIGNSYTGTNWNGCVFDGYLSDFRVYATPLSSSDILELYHTPETLSHNGTLLTQGEFVES